MELTLELDPARALMYEELADELDEDVLEQTMEQVVSQKITHLYDNQNDIKRRGRE